MAKKKNVAPANRRRGALAGATKPRPIRARTSPRRAPSHEEIAEAAYLRYLSRGGGDGADFDDWIEAERDLRSRSNPQTNPKPQ